MSLISGMPRLGLDAGRTLGAFRRLNGVNGGPWVRAGTYDLSEQFDAIRPAVARLHDTRIDVRPRTQAL